MTVVLDAVKEVIVDEGTCIIKQGDNGDFMFICETGALECYVAKDGEEKMVKAVEPGDAFGELALLYNCPRAASVEAAVDCVVWQLDRQTFNHIVKDGATRKREKYEKFLGNVSLLNSMGPYEKGQVSDALKPEEFADGAVVMTEGEPGDKFYIVEDGSCVATKGGTEVMTYKAGDYFGELALMRNQPRAATITAKGSLKLLALDRRTFKRLLGPLEDLLGQKVYS